MFDVFTLVGIAVVAVVGYVWYKNPDVVKGWWEAVKTWGRGY